MISKPLCLDNAHCFISTKSISLKWILSFIIWNNIYLQWTTLVIAEQSATQNVSVASQKSSFATQYLHSQCTESVQLKYFTIMQNCQMK